MNSGTTKDSWRTSSTWRSFTPSCFSGSSFRKASTSSGSNFFVGASCHRIGPSFSPSSTRPDPTKRVTDSPASPSTRRLVTKRLPFSENDETVRRLARPFGEGRRLEGRIVGAVDLDGRHLPAGILQLLRLRQLLRIERRCPRARRSSRPCRRGSFRTWSFGSSSLVEFNQRTIATIRQAKAALFKLVAHGAAGTETWSRARASLTPGSGLEGDRLRSDYCGIFGSIGGCDITPSWRTDATPSRPRTRLIASWLAAAPTIVRLPRKRRSTLTPCSSTDFTIELQTPFGLVVDKHQHVRFAHGLHLTSWSFTASTN